MTFCTFDAGAARKISDIDVPTVFLKINIVGGRIRVAANMLRISKTQHWELTQTNWVESNNVKGQSHIQSEERLRQINLVSWERRRLRDDPIRTFKKFIAHPESSYEVTPTEYCTILVLKCLAFAGNSNLVYRLLPLQTPALVALWHNALECCFGYLAEGSSDHEKVCSRWIIFLSRIALGGA